LTVEPDPEFGEGGIVTVPSSPPFFVSEITASGPWITVAGDRGLPTRRTGFVLRVFR
jgi:hypothetical protein